MGGAKLFVIDRRGLDLMRHATHALQFKPGSDVALLISMLHAIIAVVSGVVGADLSERIIVDSRVRDPPRGRLLRRERKLLAPVCSAGVAAARRR